VHYMSPTSMVTKSHFIFFQPSNFLPNNIIRKTKNWNLNPNFNKSDLNGANNQMPYKTSMNINSNIFLAIKPSNAKLNQKFKRLNYNPIQHLQFVRIRTNRRLNRRKNTTFCPERSTKKTR
jgi:hypothetical protein